MDTALNARIVAGASVLQRTVGPGPWTWRVLTGPVDGRAVVRYEGPTGTVLIGKFYPDDTGEHAFRDTAALAARGAAAAVRTLHIATPRSYEPGLRLMLQDPMPGARLDAGTLDLGALERAGTALAELHGLGGAATEVKTLADHLRELSQPLPTALAADRPQYRDRIEAALVRMATAESTWTGTRCAPLHRDFHLRQLFAAGARIGVIDWDLFAYGDPAFDVVYFTTYLRNHYDTATAQPAVEAFLRGYRAQQSIPDLEARRPAYEAFNYMRRACRRFRLRDPGWEFEIQKMMQRLEQVRW